MRVIAVDHGVKRIGLATSDPTGTLARPLAVIKHVAREEDARQVLAQAIEHQAELIIVGESFDEEGRPNLAGRRAERFAETLRGSGFIPVLMWDESMSTRDAQAARLASGVKRKKRAAPVDALAATTILQSYLDAQPRPRTGPRTTDEGH